MRIAGAFIAAGLLGVAWTLHPAVMLAIIAGIAAAIFRR